MSRSYIQVFSEQHAYVISDNALRAFDIYLHVTGDELKQPISPMVTHLRCERSPIPKFSSHVTHLELVEVTALPTEAWPNVTHLTLTRSIGVGDLRALFPALTHLVLDDVQQRLQEDLSSLLSIPETVKTLDIRYHIPLIANVEQVQAVHVSHLRKTDRLQTLFAMEQMTLSHMAIEVPRPTNAHLVVRNCFRLVATGQVAHISLDVDHVDHCHNATYQMLTLVADVSRLPSLQGVSVLHLHHPILRMEPISLDCSEVKVLHLTQVQVSELRAPALEQVTLTRSTCEKVTAPALKLLTLRCFSIFPKVMKGVEKNDLNNWW
jgi:hypothetical protein